jgi:4-diphosphocytidyl-2-C-methyl-D-erythritol kinase
MQAIDLYDEITIHRMPGAGKDSEYSVRWAEDALCPTPIDWPLEKDLAVRAHRALEAIHGRIWGTDLPVSIEVVKRIPVGGGLGGGSSDAAAVLLGLRSDQGSIGEGAMVELSSALGSDVAFFADEEPRTEDVPRAGLVTGFGDKIRRVESVPGELVLVIPPYGCPTGPVYKAYDELLKERASLDAAERAARGITGREKQTGAKESLVESRWERMSRRGEIEGDHLFNDLAMAAFRVEPRLGRLVTALSNATRRQAHVTGSGSCVFIPCGEGRIERLLTQVQRLLGSSEEFAGVKAIRTRLL